MSSLELARPHYKYFESYMQFIEEMRRQGETIWESRVPTVTQTPQQFIDHLNSLISETTYWAKINDQILGLISLRHELTEDLKEFGGHIGYEVRPSVRRQGFATEMLRLLLNTPRARQIGTLLLTCAPDNVGSNQTIIANGGILEKTMYVARINRDTNYYWITI